MQAMRQIRSSSVTSTRWLLRSPPRGIQPAERETYSNGVRKAAYRDPDGNEVGLGGAPLTPDG
jgi:hypothetical protein